MSELLFDEIKEEVKTEYSYLNDKLSFRQFIERVEEDPHTYTRTAFQLLIDAVESFGTETKQDCGEHITRYSLFNDPFDLESGQKFGKHAVFGIDRQIENIVNYIKSTASKGGDDKLLLLHGPPATAKTSIVMLLMKAFENYSKTKEGGLYTFDWVFTGDDVMDVGFRLPHESSKTESYANFSDEELFTKIPCQINDHPLMIIPRQKRRAYLEKIVEKHPNIVIPKMILENDLCRNCQTIYTQLLKKYEGDYEEITKHIQIFRLFASEIEQVAVSTVQPAQNVEGNAPLIVKEGQAYRNLAALFPGISMHQFEGKWADANRGLIHFTDMFERDVRFYKTLQTALQEHTLDFNGVQATVDVVVMGTSNVEQFLEVTGSPKNKAFLGRTKVLDVPYVVRISDEKKIYSDKFKEAGYCEQSNAKKGHHVAPYVTEFISRFAVLTRLFKPNKPFYEESELDNSVINLITHLTPVQKAAIYNNEIPRNLDRADKKTLRDPHVQKLIRQEFNPIKGIQIKKKNGKPALEYAREGMNGVSPRKIKELITDIIGQKEDSEARITTKSCLGIDPFYDTFEKIVKSDARELTILSYNNGDGVYLNPKRLLYKAQNEFDESVQADVKWAVIGVGKEKIDEDIKEYIKNVQAWAENAEIFNPVTKSYEEPSEDYMSWLEDLLGIYDERDIKKHRHELLDQISNAYLKSKTVAEEKGEDVPQLDISELVDDYYDVVYDSLLGDAIEDMEISMEDFKRVVSWAGTEREQYFKPEEQKELDRVIGNLKTRAPYCEDCAKATLKYVFFELGWDFE